MFISLSVKGVKEWSAVAVASTEGAGSQTLARHRYDIISRLQQVTRVLHALASAAQAGERGVTHADTILAEAAASPFRRKCVVIKVWKPKRAAFFLSTRSEVSQLRHISIAVGGF